MQYISTEKPIYPVFFLTIKNDEREKMMDWIRSNASGQILMIGGSGGSANVKIMAKPMEDTDPFGRTNGFAEKNEYSSLMIGFTEESDLTAFRIVFENTPKA